MSTVPSALPQRRAGWIAALLGVPAGLYVGHAVAAALIATGRAVLLPLVAGLLLVGAARDPDGPLATLAASTVTVAAVTALVTFGLALLG